jgi:pimeloyl-ACP methyl ester carboxylesterase
MGTGAQEPLFAALATLTMPSLLLTGALDQKFTTIGGEMAAAMPNARQVVIPNAGHAAQTDQPAACATEVEAFLAAAGDGSVQSLESAQPAGSVQSLQSTKPEGVPA